jgi:radical SAM superfamily enzyme YgiQ (UPF0313 family)
LQKPKKLAFYVDYERFKSKEAPPILFFVAYLRNIGFSVDFFISEDDLLKSLKKDKSTSSANAHAINKRQDSDNKSPYNKNDFQKYDVCLLSLMSADNLRNILQTAIKIKNIDPFIVNVLGGTGVYSYTKELINAEGIDIVIEGDAEKTLPAILDSIKTYDKYALYAQQNKSHINSGVFGSEIFESEIFESEIFKKFPDDTKSNIKKDEAYFCTEKHMTLLFKNRGSFSSPVLYLPDEIFFERIIQLPSSLNYESYNSQCIAPEINGTVCSDDGSSFRFKCKVKVPISGVAVKLNDGSVRYFKKINRENDAFPKFYNPYKALISEADFENLIAPHPTEEEINEQYTSYPWDIYDYYKFESIGIYAQRGCSWGKCSYCSIVNYNYRKLNIQFILQVLNEAKNHNVFGISFDDDLFVQNKKWINNLLDLIIAHELNKRFSFTAMVKVEHVHDIALLNKLKKANFSKIQIGVESFLPEKVSFFRKTKAGKEAAYIKKAKEIIAYSASIGLIPSSFIILTTPEKKFGLFDIVNEIGEIIDILINVYGSCKIMPIFGYNNFIAAYPNAPLLKENIYSNFMVAVSGYITNEDIDMNINDAGAVREGNINIKNKNAADNYGDKKAAAIKNLRNKNGINLLNLKTIKIPYMYKFYNFRVTHFIDALFKGYKERNADADFSCRLNADAGSSLIKSEGSALDLNITDDINNIENKKENKLKKERKYNNIQEPESEENIMLLHTEKILNSLNNTFDMYGTPLFVLYEILDELELNIKENKYSEDLIKKIFKKYFNYNNNDINFGNYIINFKKLIAANKIEPDKALNVFKYFFKGVNYIKDSQEKQRDQGKEIIKILDGRLDHIKKLYALNK